MKNSSKQPGLSRGRFANRGSVVLVTAGAIALAVSGCAAVSESVDAPPTTAPAITGAPQLAQSNTTVTITATRSATGDSTSFEYGGEYSSAPSVAFGGVTVGQTGTGSLAVTAQATGDMNEGTTQVANWFTSHAAQSNGDEVATVNSDNTALAAPRKLNYAFTGTLTINGTQVPVVVGEGTTGLGAANWWIGGMPDSAADWTIIQDSNHGPVNILLTGTKPCYQLYGTGLNSNFNISPWDPQPGTVRG